MTVWVLLAALAAADDACRQGYQPYFLERTGITRAEWNENCDKGGDSKRFFSDRWVAQEKKSKEARAAALVRAFGDLSPERLAPEEREALMAIDIDALPSELQPVAQKQRKALERFAAGLPPEDPEKCDKAQARKVRKQVAALKKAGYDEIEFPQECEWFRDLIKCSWEEMEEKLPFKFLHDCEKENYYCLMHVNEPLWSYVAAYRSGARKPSEVVGNQFFGLGTTVKTCRDGSFDGD